MVKNISFKYAVTSNVRFISEQDTYVLKSFPWLIIYAKKHSVNCTRGPKSRGSSCRILWKWKGCMRLLCSDRPKCWSAARVLVREWFSKWSIIRFLQWLGWPKCTTFTLKLLVSRILLCKLVKSWWPGISRSRKRSRYSRVPRKAFPSTIPYMRYMSAISALVKRSMLLMQRLVNNSLTQ